MRPDVPDRHDRSRRFLQNTFPWKKVPSDNLLMEAADTVHVTFRLSADSHSSNMNLLTLAAANILLRLPFKVSFGVPQMNFEAAPPPPYAGASLQMALELLASQLDVCIDFVQPPEHGGASILIEGLDDQIGLWIGTKSWTATLRGKPLQSVRGGNAVSAYAAAAMAGAETVRAWARSAAAAQEAGADDLASRATRLADSIERLLDA